jgi:hypothetical protein
LGDWGRWVTLFTWTGYFKRPSRQIPCLNFELWSWIVGTLFLFMMLQKASLTWTKASLTLAKVYVWFAIRYKFRGRASIVGHTPSRDYYTSIYLLVPSIWQKDCLYVIIGELWFRRMMALVAPVKEAWPGFLDSVVLGRDHEWIVG